MPDSNRTYPVRVDVRLTESERDALNAEAMQRGIPRQELLRARVLSEANQPAPVPEIKPVHYSKGRDSIDAAMAAVNRRYDVPHSQLESLICTVICALNAKG
tara:strand:+ start:271 stop:576 length:306 start_codon:yes stop_codon:yes gene_type:complete